MKFDKLVNLILEQQSFITDDWFNQGGFEAYKKPSIEPYEIAKAPGTLQTLEGPQQYQAGFYIMAGPKGEKYSMPPEKFKELKVDNGNGTASPKPINKVVKLADSNGKVKTSWGAELEYKAGQDYIVKHGPNDYGVVKKDIFNQTYVSTARPTASLGRAQIRPPRLTRGMGAAGVAGISAALSNELSPDQINRMSGGGLGIKGKFEAMP